MNRENVVKQLLELSKSINWKCEICGEEDENKLVNHHISYIPEEIIVVCGSCHAKIHGEFGRDSEIIPQLPKKDWKLIKRLLYYSDLGKVKDKTTNLDMSVLDCFRDPKMLEGKVDDWPSKAELREKQEGKEI